MHVSSRTLALVLTLAGAAALFFRTPEEAAAAIGLLGAVLALAAIWLRTRIGWAICTTRSGMLMENTRH